MGIVRRSSTGKSERLANPAIRFYQASSSEMSGKVRGVPQNERTPFHPRSPYGAATGETHSVRELCEVASACAGLDWEDHVVVDERFVRKSEVDLPVGDAGKARLELGWEPTVGLCALIAMMVEADIRIEQDPSRLRPSDVPVLEGCPDKLPQATGWQRRFSLDQSLADILDDWRARIAATRP